MLSFLYKDNDEDENNIKEIVNKTMNIDDTKTKEKNNEIDTINAYFTLSKIQSLEQNMNLNQTLIKQEDIYIRKELFKLTKEAEKLWCRYVELKKNENAEKNRLEHMFTAFQPLYKQKSELYCKTDPNIEYDQCCRLEKWLYKAQIFNTALSILIQKLNSKIEKCDVEALLETEVIEAEENFTTNSTKCVNPKKALNTCATFNMEFPKQDEINGGVFGGERKMLKTSRVGRLNGAGVLDYLANQQRHSRNTLLTLCENDYFICVGGKMIDLRKLNPCSLKCFLEE